MTEKQLLARVAWLEKELKRQRRLRETILKQSRKNNEQFRRIVKAQYERRIENVKRKRAA